MRSQSACFGVWLGVWSAAWLAGVYFFGTETPALFGGFFGCVAGGVGAQLFLGDKGAQPARGLAGR
jgi:hypothetical protein